MALCVSFLISCAADRDASTTGSTALYGSWRWVSSVGGIEGSTRTPKTEGIEHRLVFLPSDSMQWFRNDTLMSQDPFGLALIEDHAGNPGLAFRSSNPWYFGEWNWVRPDTIVIDEHCADCDRHTFVRIR